MKKSLLMFPALLLSMALLAGCGGAGVESDSSNTPSTNTQTTTSGSNTTSSGGGTTSSEENPPASSDTSAKDPDSVPDSSESSEIITTNYYLVLNGTELPMTYVELETREENKVGYASVEVNAHANDPVSFKIYDEYLYGSNQNIGPSPDDTANNVANNVRYGDDMQSMYMKADVEGTLYLDVYDNDGVPGYSVWLAGGEIGDGDTETGWFLKSNSNEWGETDPLASSPDEAVRSQYYIQKELAADDEFKFNCGDLWLGYDSLEDGGAKSSFSRNNSKDESNNNIIVVTAGTYDFYVKENFDDTWSIYVGKASGGSEVKGDYEAEKFTISVNGTAVNASFEDVSSSTKGDEDTWIQQFKVVITAKKGDVVAFTYDGEAIYPGASSGNLSYDNDTKVLTVKKDATEKDLYLKAYSDGFDTWFDVDKSTSEDTATITFSYTGDAGWGNAFYIIGSFCDWDITQALRLEHNDGVNTGSIDLDIGETYQYKIVKAEYENPSTVTTWESGENRTLTVSETTTITITNANF